MLSSLSENISTAWIGLSREEGGDWEWLDSDQPVKYTNWRSSSHMDGHGMAVIFESDGQWGLQNGTGQNHVICEKYPGNNKLFPHTA